MDFRRKTRQRIERKPEFEDLDKRFPHNIMLYKYPPLDDIQIPEFEELALERLKVLRIFDQAGMKQLRFLSDEYKEYVNNELNREGLKGYLRLCTSTGGNTTVNSAKHETELNARRRDYISHFILRLAYCRTDELQRWFMGREMELFKYKFAALNSSEIKQFLEINQLGYVPLNETQKDAIKDGLYESTMSQSVTKVDILDFYKVPFTQVLDLVRSRRCYLKNGYAYVNSNDFVSIIAVHQSNEIEHGLKTAQRFTKDVENDERIFHLLKSLHTSYTGKDYTISKSDRVSIESLDQLSKKSYPLCMRMSHEHLRTNHHVKYFGRMQYCLFLKGIGVTLEDCLKFWRDEFTKKIDEDQFRKKYEYNIYHNYGKKGSMVNYTPYSCLRIINESAQSSDGGHGCPFKTLDSGELKSKLGKNGFSGAHAQEVMSYVDRKHYQLACAKYFQISHTSPHEIAVTHPNQYFEESQILMGNRADKKPDRAKIIKRNVNGNNTSMADVMNSMDDNDELWNIADTQENSYQQKKMEETAFEDDIDLEQIGEDVMQIASYFIKDK